MKLVLFLIIIIITMQAKAQLPASGPLTISRIADYMAGYDEITALQRSSPLNLATLNAYSHLADKTAPFSVSDWRGYYLVPRTARQLLVNNPALLGLDGYYTVYPDGVTPLTVYCDMTTDGGGWMLIARSQPGASATAGGWGWNAPKRGVVNSFSDAYNAAWMQTWHGKARFTSILFGNRKNSNDNNWGPFIYKISGIDYTALMTSDTEQLYNNTTITYNLSVYNNPNFPQMQQLIGYYQSGTNQNFFYLRDVPGCFNYGGYPYGFNTYYINSSLGGPESWIYSGPWGRQDNAVDGSNNFIQTTGDTHYGGTWQYMIFVR